jgi:hypothetical protein
VRLQVPGGAAGERPAAQFEAGNWKLENGNGRLAYPEFGFSSIDFPVSIFPVSSLHFPRSSRGPL